MFEFLRVLVAFFEKYEIPYMLSGSMASSLYTGPRYTRDFDFVVHLKPTDVPVLKSYFSDGYYCDEDAMTDAIRRKSMFNIIDHKSNFKADFIVLKEDSFEYEKFNRRRAEKFLDFSVSVISPEDLLISKLQWIQDLVSETQQTDILLLSKLSYLDWEYINRWIKILKINTYDLFKND
jgi:hypothetical protein